MVKGINWMWLAAIQDSSLQVWSWICKVCPKSKWRYQIGGHAKSKSAQLGKKGGRDNTISI